MASKGATNTASNNNGNTNSNAAAGPSTSTSGGSSGSDHTSIVLEYLIKRGYHSAAQALRAEIDPSSAKDTNVASTGGAGASATGRSISQDGFERKNLGKNGSNKAVREDPMPWRDGLFGLRDFVYGSLDIHRPELLPILLPVYVHSFLDLVLLGYKDQSEIIYNAFLSDYESSNPAIVRLLTGLKTPAQIEQSEQAVRWRKERYVVRMTRRGWSLLLGWLQGGTSGLGMNSAQGEIHERGREKMLGIINERVRVDVINQKGALGVSQAHTGKMGAEGGLESELQLNPMMPGMMGQDNQQQSQHQHLKLGPMPADPKLDREVQRALIAEGIAPLSIAGSSTSTIAQIQGTDTEMRDDSKPSTSTSTTEQLLQTIQASDLPPYPPSFRTVDVRREVEKVREARKRIKLGPVPGVVPGANGMVPGMEAGILVGQGGSGARYNLPSVCMFTLHDTGDTLISTEFSEDSSLLACGFSESYIRLWNLKGDPLQSISSSFDPSHISSSSDLYSSYRTTLPSSESPTTRKLIGHSGPVYSTSFDPIPGPSGPPRYLLSSSQDSTVRLWSLDTYSNIVAYRGHRDPVWDVEWGPRGVYFASASRDRTARLWTTERVAAVRIFAGHLSDVETVKFHPNSLYLATGSADRTCRLWDVQKGACVRVFVGHSGPVSTIAISPDGRYLASAGDDHSINLWDLGSSRLVKSMVGHSSRIHSLSFSAESSILVSGSSDCTMRVWDVLSSKTTSMSVNGTGTTASSGGGGGGYSSTGTGGNTAAAKERQKETENSDLLLTLPTKRTPVFATKFTPRNLCLAAGPIF